MLPAVFRCLNDTWGGLQHFSSEESNCAKKGSRQSPAALTNARCLLLFIWSHGLFSSCAELWNFRFFNPLSNEEPVEDLLMPSAQHGKVRVPERWFSSLWTPWDGTWCSGDAWAEPCVGHVKHLFRMSAYGSPRWTGLALLYVSCLLRGVVDFFKACGITHVGTGSPDSHRGVERGGGWVTQMAESRCQAGRSAVKLMW